MAHQPIIDNSQIPEYVTHATDTLQSGGFEAFLVGGCVRDLTIGRTPKDWDVTTNAKPEQIIALFEKTIYENTFGTVGVCIPKVTHVTEGDVPHETKYDIIEVTPYRLEATYSDFRHPDQVMFSENIEDDLKRRDFTMNALAFDPINRQLIDLYKGQEDIKDRVVKCVGQAGDRFKEDALRMLRAIRFASQLNFSIDYDTIQAVVNNSDLIKNISEERIRDEFVKIIESDNSAMGIAMMSKLGLLKYIIPELEEGIDCEQGGAHTQDVFVHCLGALEHASKKGLPLEIRLSALFHDIGKPRSRHPGTKKAYTFYGHEVVGARMVKVIMERLKFTKKTIELVISMVRNHMFFSDTEQITLSAVRRIVQKVGKDHIWELMQVREADRVGMKKTEAPYRLRKYHAMIDEVLRDPISVGQLAIDGEVLIRDLGMKPSRRMGWILHALLEEVLDEPKKNTIEYLKERTLELDKLSDTELQALGEKAKELKDELEEKEISKVHAKHGIKK
jgi:tRNA nucleotidyltransferase (CCA-adding enzyme)